jgi:hypothetical protein
MISVMTKTRNRHKSKLVQAGEDRMREVLLDMLKEHRWSPSAVSDALDMGGGPNVLRAIRALGLQEVYDAARYELGLKPGRAPREE